jgi:hypothetical protein
MADKLLPKVSTSTNPSSAAGATDGLDMTPMPAMPRVERSRGTSYSCTPLFRTWLTLYDGTGGEWKVQYDGIQFKGRVKEQRHYRLTSGWRCFVRDTGIQIGNCGVQEVSNVCFGVTCNTCNVVICLDLSFS